VCHDQRIVPTSSGTSNAAMADFLRRNIPVMNRIKITIPHISRAKVSGHAWP
jgi:hypothetical protein